MKKVLKFLMSTLFVLSVVVFGTSCQDPAGESGDFKEVDISDVKFEVGTYSFVSETILSVTEPIFPSGNDEMNIGLTDVIKGTLVIEGTDPKSKVEQIMDSDTMVVKALDDNTWAALSMLDDDYLKSQSMEEATIVRDEEKKAILLIYIPDNNSDVMTFEKFMKVSFVGCTIKQNASGTIIILEKTSSKTVVTITRK